jgi:cold shock CspA family protein
LVSHEERSRRVSGEVTLHNFQSNGKRTLRDGSEVEYKRCARHREGCKATLRVDLGTG